MPSFTKYATWAANEVLKRSPASLTADWGKTRTDAIAAIGRKGIFETLSLCCALCEFLGTLYRGTRGNSDYQDFQGFVNKFFPKRYRKVHHFSGRRDRRSDFYTMFRTKTLHGGTPSGIMRLGKTPSVAGWRIGFDIRDKHLRVINGSLYVDGEQFREDLGRATALYAKELQRDTTLQKRWRRGFWWRFQPQYLPGKDWRLEGSRRGIPA